MSERPGLDRLLDGIVEFFVAHEAINGRVWSEDERDGLRSFAVVTLAYLSVEAKQRGIEPELNAILHLLSRDDT